MGQAAVRQRGHDLRQPGLPARRRVPVRPADLRPLRRLLGRTVGQPDRRCVELAAEVCGIEHAHRPAGRKPYDAYYGHWSRVRKVKLPAAGDLGLAWTQRLVAMNTLVVSNILLNAGDDVTVQALIGDEFRPARRSHTSETTGRCIVRRRVRDERVASAI